MKINRVALIAGICGGQAFGMAGTLASLLFKEFALVPVFSTFVFTASYIANRICRTDEALAMSFRRLRPYHWSLFMISGILLLLVLPRTFR